jgi:predicted RNase H-like HicB family nuclease
MLTRYIEEAIKQAVYEKLDDGSYWGEIPSCPGTNGHALTLSECQQELRDVVEEWVLQNLHDDVPLPVIAGLDLNKHEAHASSSHQA